MRPLFALVPVNDPRKGKSRLAPVLSAQERYALNLALARRTLQVCADEFGAGHTVAVTSSRAVREIAGSLQVRAIDEEPGRNDLNAALAAAADFAIGAGARGLLVVPTDLPLVSGRSLRAAVDRLPRPAGCVIVPDRRGRGTNLLALSPPARNLFAFGEPSLERHARLAARMGYEVVVFRSEDLAVDLDLPEDYFHLEHTQTWPIFASTTRKPLANRSGSTPTSRA